MNEIGEKYLPIGTVVMLNGGTKRVMITGFCSMAADDEDVIYDYSGCMYPEGFLSSDQTALFNHSQIAKVYHMGLVDEEEKQFKESLNTIVQEMTKAINENLAQSTEPAMDVPVANVEEAIPPIGPGLPGYVAPQVDQATEDSVNIPPIGPGLPGYVAPQVEQATEDSVNIPPIGPGLPGYVAPQMPIESDDIIELDDNDNNASGIVQF